MLYGRSLEVEKRLDHVLHYDAHLIWIGRYSTPKMTEEVGVSILAVSLCVTALWVRGYDIRGEKLGGDWSYVLGGRPPTLRSQTLFPSLNLRGEPNGHG